MGFHLSVDACVVETEKKIYGVYNMENGGGIIATSPMTDEELIAYRAHPETFFGVCKDPVKRVSDPIDLYKWLHKTYKDSSKGNCWSSCKGQVSTKNGEA